MRRGLIVTEREREQTRQANTSEKKVRSTRQARAAETLQEPRIETCHISIVSRRRSRPLKGGIRQSSSSASRTFHILDDDANANTVKELNLAFTYIGDEGIRALAEAITESDAVRTLVVNCCNIHVEGARVLADVIRTSKAMECLALWGNDVGDEGVKAVADAMMTSRSLQELRIEVRSNESLGALAFALPRSQALKVLVVYARLEGYEAGFNLVLASLSRSFGIEELVCRVAIRCK